MIIEFEEIMDAFEFVSFDHTKQSSAFLNKETGQVYFRSEFDNIFEELPEDIDDEKYIAIPHKLDLGLGRDLVFDFAYQFLPNEIETITSLFSRKGAYSRFKSLLEDRALLDKWYEFESKANEEALRLWCEANEIETRG